ncbi:hypothetical protein DV515_00001782 [Chloebia gouldiae]|uniref:Uncharacterized protein n=1 Tax=Chloebia gouldiae TaxID=44316 RepID=A0A3L8SYR6_CHLGU|nr:hypothetical protein DV515_00001782 [Chloebia gouldiae]
MPRKKLPVSGGGRVCASSKCCLLSSREKHKKWDCATGDFYSFSCFVVCDGTLLSLSRACRKHYGCCGGLGKASRNLTICRRV